MAESAWDKAAIPGLGSPRSHLRKLLGHVFLFFWAHRLHLLGEFLYGFCRGFKVPNLWVFIFCHGLQLGRHGFQCCLALPALWIQLLAQGLFQPGKVCQSLLAVTGIFTQLLGQFRQFLQQRIPLFRAHLFCVLNLFLQFIDLLRLAAGFLRDFLALGDDLIHRVGEPERQSGCQQHSAGDQQGAPFGAQWKIAAWIDPLGGLIGISVRFLNQVRLKGREDSAAPGLIQCQTGRQALFQVQFRIYPAGNSHRRAWMEERIPDRHHQPGECWHERPFPRLLDGPDPPGKQDQQHGCACQP